MHCPRYNSCLVLLVLFHLGSSTPHRKWPPPSRSASSLDDFPEHYVIFYGDDGMASTIAPPTAPPSTTKLSSTSEPFSTANPYRFYIDQFKKKSDSNQEKKLRPYNMNSPVERLRIKLHKLVDILINWIKNLD